jgi:hypothetical protein
MINLKKVFYFKIFLNFFIFVIFLTIESVDLDPVVIEDSNEMLFKNIADENKKQVIQVILFQYLNACQLNLSDEKKDIVFFDKVSDYLDYKYIKNFPQILPILKLIDYEKFKNSTIEELVNSLSKEDCWKNCDIYSLYNKVQEAIKSSDIVSKDISVENIDKDNLIKEGLFYFILNKDNSYKYIKGKLLNDGQYKNNYEEIKKIFFDEYKKKYGNYFDAVNFIKCINDDDFNIFIHTLIGLCNLLEKVNSCLIKFSMFLMIIKKLKIKMIKKTI